jgi:hypothetical protein
VITKALCLFDTNTSMSLQCALCGSAEVRGQHRSSPALPALPFCSTECASAMCRLIGPKQPHDSTNNMSDPKKRRVAQDRATQETERFEGFLDAILHATAEPGEFIFLRQLPEEMRLSVFQHMSLLDLQRVMRLDTTTRNVAGDQRLWHQLFQRIAERTLGFGPRMALVMPTWGMQLRACMMHADYLVMDASDERDFLLHYMPMRSLHLPAILAFGKRVWLYRANIIYDLIQQLWPLWPRHMVFIPRQGKQRVYELPERAPAPMDYSYHDPRQTFDSTLQQPALMPVEEGDPRRAHYGITDREQLIRQKRGVGWMQMPYLLYSEEEGHFQVMVSGAPVHARPLCTLLDAMFISPQQVQEDYEGIPGRAYELEKLLFLPQLPMHPYPLPRRLTLSLGPDHLGAWIAHGGASDVLGILSSQHDVMEGRPLPFVLWSVSLMVHSPNPDTVFHAVPRPRTLEQIQHAWHACTDWQPLTLFRWERHGEPVTMRGRRLELRLEFHLEMPHFEEQPRLLGGVWSYVSARLLGAPTATEQDQVDYECFLDLIIDGGFMGSFNDLMKAQYRAAFDARYLASGWLQDQWPNPAGPGQRTTPPPLPDEFLAGGPPLQLGSLHHMAPSDSTALIRLSPRYRQRQLISTSPGGVERIATRM